MSITFTEQQSTFISYAKALAMISVVMGHYQWTLENIHDPYLYHMPLFFLLGGVVMKPITNVKKWLKDCFNKYIAYLILWSMVIGLASAFINHTFNSEIVLRFVDLGRFNPIEFALRNNMHSNSLFMVAWFLVAFFIAANAFKIKLTLLNHLMGAQAARIICLAIGLIIGYLAISYVAPMFKFNQYWRQQQDFWLYNFICQLGVAYMYIALGYALQPYLKIFSSFTLLIICLVALITFIGNDSFHALGMSWSQYPDGFFIHLISSLLGCALVLCIAYLLSLSVDSSVLRAIGRYSKDIMTMHMLAFVCIDLLAAHMGYFEYRKIMALVHYEAPSMWAIYLFCGLFMPISVRLLIKQMQQHLRFYVRTIGQNYWPSVMMR